MTDSVGVSLEGPKRVEYVTELRMLRDQILVRPLEWEPSKIIEVVRKGRALRGVVVAVGPGDYLKRRRPHPDGKRQIVTRTTQFRAIEVKPGEIVELGGLNIFDGLGYSFPEVVVGGVRHLICQEADVALVLDEECNGDQSLS